MKQPIATIRPRLAWRHNLVIMTMLAWLLVASCVEARPGLPDPRSRLRRAATTSRPTALRRLELVLSGHNGIDPRTVAEQLSPQDLAEALDSLSAEAAAGRLDPSSLRLPRWLLPEDVRQVILEAVHLVFPKALNASPCPTCRPADDAEIEALAARAGLLGLPRTQRQVLQARGRPSP